MLTPEIVGDVHISVDVPSFHEGVVGHGGSPSRLVRTREVVAHTGGLFSSQRTAVGCAPLEYHRARRAGHADSDSAGRDFNELPMRDSDEVSAPTSKDIGIEA